MLEALVPAPELLQQMSSGSMQPWQHHQRQMHAFGLWTPDLVLLLKLWLAHIRLGRGLISEGD